MPAEKHASTLLILVVLLVAVAGVTAVWSGVSLLLRSGAAWMAVVTALDAALLLRLANVRPGPARAGVAMAITVLTALAAWYVIAASQIGLLMGVRPADAIWKIGPGLAWLYNSTNLGWTDLAWLLFGLAIAWRLGR